MELLKKLVRLDIFSYLIRLDYARKNNQREENS